MKFNWSKDLLLRVVTESGKEGFELLKKLKPDQFLDIGAHWDMYTVAVAFDPKLADVKICAFKPDKINRTQLHANLFLNRLDRAIALK